MASTTQALQLPPFNPTAIATSPYVTLYVLDQGNEALKRVEKPGKDGGLISRVAGQYHGSSGGPHSTQLLQPRSVAVGPDGSPYVADTDSAVVRKVRPHGRLRPGTAG